MDLASARGTKLSDIVLDHRPNTGRGKKITPAQEGVLRRLYEQELPSVSNGEVPVKAFWVNLASRFHEQTGREYSWLSVKRRAAGWHQKSPESDQRPNISHVSELGGDDPVAGPSHPDISRGSPRQQAPFDSEQSALPQKAPSLHTQDSTALGLSQLERNAAASDGLQRNLVQDIIDPIQDINSNIKSPRASQRRPRSRSPQRGSQPRYRYRSPSTTRRTKLVSKRLHRQLAPSSDEIVVTSGPNPFSGRFPAHDDMQPGHLGKQNPPGFNHARKSVEKDESENDAHGSARLKQEESIVGNSLLASPHLSEQDDLPPAPTRTIRRHVAK